VSLERCIPELLEEGRITPEQAERAREIYGRRVRHHQRSFGEPTAAALASEETVDAIERAADQAQRQRLLQHAVQKRLIGDLASYKGDNSAAAAQALFDHDGKAPYMNVEALRKTIVGRAHARMADFLERHRRNLLGEVRDKSGLVDIVRELRGENTGNLSAREMAEAFRIVAEDLRLRFNAAGGAIGKLENWAPQSHNSLKVRSVDFEQWADFIAPLLDRERMVDDVTGQPFDDETLRSVLHDVYETVSTEGWAGRTLGGVDSGKKLANQRAEHRFLHFRDAAAWFEYDAAFGDGNVFDAMIGYVEGMARDIAHMEILGPNPAAQVEWLKDGLMKGAHVGVDRKGTAIDRARSGALMVQQMYDITSGALNSPANAKWARRFGTLRSINSAQMLGGAMISAITDVGFQAITRAFNGLPITGAMTGYLKMLNPLDAADRMDALRSGVVAEESAQIGSAQQRWLGESGGHEWARRLAEGVLRVSGLSPWTAAGRHAFDRDFQGLLAKHAGVAFAKVPRPVREAMERYGIDGADWEKIRATPLEKKRGATFLRPIDIADRKLADKVHAMMLTETDYAVPVASVRGRAYTTFGRPGSLAGEISRNMMLFKSFGTSVILSHGGRALSLRPVNGAIYAAGGTIILTALGALAVQLKEIAKGRDPLPMNDLPSLKDGRLHGGFWSRAMFQGGGFGIFGDFASAGASERTGSLAEAVAGPGVGTIGDTIRLATGNMSAADAARRYTPGGTMWYGRLAYERLLIDELRAWTDENYYDSWSRVERAAADKGQDFWWRPGEGRISDFHAPERLPNAANAWEGEVPE
jgi:hypothetical protein